MVLLFICYLIGSGLGGLLAIGTCWTASRRYLQRSVALVLAQPMAIDSASVAILASHHNGDRERTLWMMELISKLALGGGEDNPFLLDICGATHVELLEEVAEHHPEWSIEVFDSQPAIQHLLRSQVLLPRLALDKLVVNPGASLDHITSTQSHYNLVLVLDNLVHSLSPHKRLGYFQAWAKLIKPNSGYLLPSTTSVVVRKQWSGTVPNLVLEQQGMHYCTQIRAHD
ncbi:hypothetical protein BASA81_001142 [Batrachochytrium salamandrivorans]|nr:hypothetical protein BASA81_001142 [Batrachochytrium salamandrivorans]